MVSKRKLKALAFSMVKSLKAHGFDVPKSVVLHAMAAAGGKKDWHVLCAMKDESTGTADVARLRSAPELLDAAKLVLERWERGDLAEAVRRLSAAVNAAEEHDANTDERSSSADQSGARPVDYWGEDPSYPVEDWQHEVANGNTRRGYWEWVASRREQDGFERRAVPLAGQGEEGCLCWVNPDTGKNYGVHPDCPKHGNPDEKQYVIRVLSKGERSGVSHEARNVWYMNYYRHTDCPEEPGIEWEDEWDCMCNDRCPACNAEIEPYHSEEVLRHTLKVKEALRAIAEDYDDTGC